MAFPDGTADFRSDTVTRPTEAMRRAMAAADVGDDVYSEDPTVAALEEEAARLVGKEAAVYTPSGTMGNQLAINLLAAPGTELVAVDDAHVRDYERAAASMISGVAFRTVAARGGVIGAEALGELLAAAGTIRPRISALVWENTHNASGGRVVPLEAMAATTAVARSHGLAVHLDGARLFNAVAASGIPADRYAALADTVQFCFSKGLGAPVGSILCGEAAVIAEARYRRRQLGGGMRQAGVIAAAALVALGRSSSTARRPRPRPPPGRRALPAISKGGGRRRRGDQHGDGGRCRAALGGGRGDRHVDRRQDQGRSDPSGCAPICDPPRCGCDRRRAGVRGAGQGLLGERRKTEDGSKGQRGQDGTADGRRRPEEASAPLRSGPTPAHLMTYR